MDELRHPNPSLRPSRLHVFLFSALLTTACDATSTPGDEDGPTDLAEALDGHDFLLQSIEGHELVDGTEIRIGFRDGEVSAHAGCNHISGPFEIEGGILRVEGLGSTQIGCQPELHAQDEWVMALLTGSPEIRFDDPELTIEGDEGTLVLVDREVASPDRPLVGTHWIGNGTGDGNTITFGPGWETATVRFEQDGALRVFTGCQVGEGSYSATETTIEVEELAYTEEPCDAAELESLSAAVHAVLADGATIELEIDEANLTLERDGKLLLFREGD